ncbi:chemotaxis protein [Scytonema hofmannii PCC 7110]|uniref:Chemotaxis protein n=1 Tax=Scytonema hofmannii PCC 7110 TaxID=128403 RepID=A0A139WWH8_9CYAN|nr:GAF domain-containing protein [Scytonema hofmannii]KYC36790.1 chemotaxis protein [Scytonema hofmannii PCC 7110]
MQTNRPDFYARRLTSWFQRASLRTKAIAFAFAIGTLPVFVIGMLTYQMVNQSTTREISNNKQDKARLLADSANRFMLRSYDNLQIIAQLISLSNGKFNEGINRTQIETKLNDYLDSEKSYESIAILDINGNAIAASKGQLISNQKNENYFQAVLKTRSPYISQPIETKDPELGKIYLALPIKNNTGEILHIIRAIIPLKYLESVVFTTQTSQDNYHLVDTYGRIFLCRDGASVGKYARDKIPNWKQMSDSEKVTTAILFNKQENVEELITYVPWQKLEKLPDLKWKLVLSTNPATALAAQRDLLLVFQIGTLVTALIVGGISAIFANRLVYPIVTASTAVKKLGQGNLDTRIAIEGKDELAILGSNINLMADQLQLLLQEQTEEAERLKVFTNVLLSIRQSLDSAELFNTTVKEARIALKADRVVIYQFYTEGGGKVIAESVDLGFPVALQKTIEDSCIDREIIEAYSKGRVLATNNVLEAGFSFDHLKLLKRLQIKANLVTPIIKDNYIFGFLIAHHCQEPHLWQPYEINFLRQLAIQVGLTLERVSLLEVTQTLKDLAIHLSNTHNSQEIYNFAVQTIRKALKADRTVIYKIDENFQGSVIAESVADGWSCFLGAEISDPCLKDYAEKYQQGRVVAISNIYQANLSECYIQQLETFEVKANLVAPILLGDKLFGLLIAHQCSQPRLWQQSEVDLFEQFVRIVGLALERTNLLAQAEKGRLTAEQVSREQRQQKERLQLQLLKLIDDVEAASRGDLTVRADVTSGEIGTVADFFNSILENLREIVIQVKVAATEVNAAIAENSGAMSQLATQSLKQTKEIGHTLDTIDQMKLSITAVSKSAKQAAEVARTAYHAAETGGIAMDLTVENILSLRETVGETAKKVKRLGESSQQISRVVGLINQIAMQTNLLAINTGIEANRAGEDAQGFAVIAEEITVLAAQSTAATSEIEEIVANIQRETSQVVKAMELGTTQVVEGTRLVQNTKQSLNHILDVCRQIDLLVHSISTATVSQVQTSKEVSNLIQEIAKVSEMTSNSSRQVSSSLQKTVDISQQLQATVRTFKVSDQLRNS